MGPKQPPLFLMFVVLIIHRRVDVNQEFQDRILVNGSKTREGELTNARKREEKRREGCDTVLDDKSVALVEETKDLDEDKERNGRWEKKRGCLRRRDGERYGRRSP